jgi:predicted transposase/invertase (TIGR01784 family)
MKFLDIKTDYAFKKVFGSEDSVDILISFLNSIIEFKDKKKIIDLNILDPYNVPKLKGMKDTFVDVKAKLDDNTKVIIEMQVLNHDGFEKRILFNAAKNYSMQLIKGENYESLNPVIALTITNFEMFEDDEKKDKSYKSSFKLREEETLKLYKDDIELVFVELPKFKKKIDECKNIEDKWLYFIKNSENLDVIPKNLDKTISKAYNIANTANYTIDELELQVKRKEFIYIQKNSVEKAKREGRIEGIKEGKIEGIRKGKIEGITEEKIKIAKNMINDKMDINIIMKYTGLSKKQIEEL